MPQDGPELPGATGCPSRRKPAVQVIMRAMYLLFGFMGVGLFALGAMGGLYLSRYRIDMTLSWRQRLTFVVMGLLLVAIALNSLTG
jgi:hypothetical protein